MTTTAQQQLALELINRARTDPGGEFEALIVNAAAQQGVQSNITSALQYFDVDLDLFQQQLSGYASVPPLAWNGYLATSAQTHNDLMIEHDVQAHTTPGEVGIGQRIRDAGYENLQSVAESIYAYAYDILYAHAGFYIDWGNGPGGIQNPAGHRDSMLSANYTEVGVAWTSELDPGTQVGPNLTTQHFGNSFSYEAQLVGVVIDDLDGDNFYDIGEGLGGISIEAVGTSGTFVTTSWASGGYQIVLPNGIYTVTFSGDGIDGAVTQEVTISGSNVKFDAHADDAEAPADVDDGKVLTGGTGDDELLGGSGVDELRGMQGHDTINGGDGADQIWGASGDDTIYGGADNDTLRGGPDQDHVEGGNGDDLIRGQKGHDDLYGGNGNDNIKGGGGNDMMSGGGGGDFLKGGTWYDDLYGGAGNDTVAGNAHDDTLSGGSGDDLLYGGGGDDILTGGTGDDALKGGKGADVFIFDTGHDNDILRDFNADDDILQVSNALADGRSAAQIAAAATAVSDGLMLDFGGGDTILLQSFTDSAALEDAISIV